MVSRETLRPFTTFDASTLLAEMAPSRNTPRPIRVNRGRGVLAHCSSLITKLLIPRRRAVAPVVAGSQ